MIPIFQERRHISRTRLFEGVAENQSENGGQNKQQDENAPVAINVDKFLYRYAPDRLQRVSYAHWMAPGLSMAW
jgi:hypothetical protein